jgi:hypothetical protein
MRKVSLFLSSFIVMAACNNGQTTATIESKGEAKDAAIEYAYSPKEKPNWEKGKPENSAFVLSVLKKFETNNIDQMSGDFADTVTFIADQMHFTGTKDSLLKMFKEWRSKSKVLVIDMHDWEAVHGKDNNEDWVSMWYQEKRTNMEGKTDSVMSMDDVKLENGKITVIDSKQRRYPEK